MRVPNSATVYGKPSPGHDMNIRVVGTCSLWARAATLRGLNPAWTSTWEGESSVREGLGTALEAQKHTSSTVISGNASSRTVGYINKGEQKVYIKTILLFQFASISDGIPSSSS